ncbi:MAG: DUF3179 domain-containing protein [Anaerolineales bacterium]
MMAPGKFAFAVLLFLSACAPAVNTSVPTDIPPSPNNSLTPTLLPDEPPPARAESEFKTDFSKHNVPYSEILSGGPPKDGIPALKDPRFVSVSEAEAWLRPVEPVILVQVGNDARAYPIQILIWHEIANDTVGGEPLVVTFCPLCNTAIAFKRTVDGRVLDFGTTGRLRYSNLIMYDHQTESWWQQATGEAIVGELTGTQLEFYPVVIISWEDFKTAYPQGRVLSRETGLLRDYGRNPYLGYDDVNNPPFLYQGPDTPSQLPPVARVLTIDLNGEAVAYPYETLEKIGAVNDRVGGEAVVIFWQAGTVSPLDSSTTASGRDVGTAAAFSRQLDGQTLSFTLVEGKIIDDQTKSEWNILGQAVSGELKGKQLSSLVSINHFWFSWAAFKPETKIYQP